MISENFISYHEHLIIIPTWKNTPISLAFQMTDLPISETTLLAIFAFVLVFIRGLTLYVSYRQDANAQPRAPNITLVVLGDIGRSPRMQHHALNFARNECWVDFVGYDGN